MDELGFTRNLNFRYDSCVKALFEFCKVYQTGESQLYSLVGGLDCWHLTSLPLRCDGDPSGHCAVGVPRRSVLRTFAAGAPAFVLPLCRTERQRIVELGRLGLWFGQGPVGLSVAGREGGGGVVKGCVDAAGDWKPKL